MNALKLELQDSQSKAKPNTRLSSYATPSCKSTAGEIMKLEAKNTSLIAELDNTRAQCVQWQRDAELAKAEMKQAQAEAEAAKEEA